MRISNFDLDKEILVVAEIGNNHEGSFSLAEELIGLAAEAGAGAVKFQTIIPEKLVSEIETERIAQLRKFSLSYEDFLRLKDVADNSNILFLSTPFDIESALFLVDLVPAFKIASGDNNFFPLINAVARSGKPIILSTGMSTMEQIRSTRDFIIDIWDQMAITDHNLAVLHCVANYPTSAYNANLLFIKELESLGLTVGYSDHTIGIDAAVVSVALGARIIEKHFTISKDYSNFHDHRMSADPKDLKELIYRVKETISMMGTGKKRILESEESIVQKARRSIVANRDLEKGVVLHLKDLSWVRPADGLGPGSEHIIIGKVLNRQIKKGEKILASDVQ